MASPQTPPSEWDQGNARAWMVKQIVVASVVVCTALYLLRLLARRVTNTPLLASDYTLGISVLVCWVIGGLNISIVHFGLGQHVEAVVVHDPSLTCLTLFVKNLVASSILYPLGQLAIKSSLLLLYRCLFTSKRLILIINIIGVVCVTWTIIFDAVLIFSCDPIHALWDLQIQPISRCIDEGSFNIGMAVPNMLLDIMVLAIPIREVWKLQLDLQSKVQLTFVFLLGGWYGLPLVRKLGV
ncbi:MAG: hypothetical protein MMC33_008486 [Icmadophila ericetorum]|nr:hypothetical protein [Icmadophila ericetorum]